MRIATSLLAVALLGASIVIPVNSIPVQEPAASGLAEEIANLLEERGHPVPATALVNGVETPFQDAVRALQPISETPPAQPLPPTHDAGFALRGVEISCRTAAWVQAWSWSGAEPFINTEFTETPGGPAGTVDRCQHDYATGVVRAEVNPELDPANGDFWLACLDAGQGGPANPYWAWAASSSPCHRDDFGAFSMTGMVGLLRVDFGSLIVEQWHGGVDHEYPDETNNGAAVTLAD